MTWVRILLVLSNLFCYSLVRCQMIYKAVSPGKDTITYLVGTFNLLPKDQFEYALLLDTILDEVDLVFTESFYEEKGLRPLVHAKDRIRMLSYPHKKRLEDFMSREEYRQVYAYYHFNFGINKRVFKQLSYFIPIVMDQQIRYGNEQYIKSDRYILQQAEKKKKTIYNLDQPALTQGGFDALAGLYPPGWLLQMIRNDSAYLSEIIRRRNCYLQQDTACLKAGIQEKIKAHPAEYYKLLNRRTQYWAGEIDRTAGTKNLILAGIELLLEEEDGLLELFRRKGYTVQLIFSQQ